MTKESLSLGGLILFGVFVAAGSIGYAHMTEDTVTLTITDKYVKNYSSDSKYLIQTDKGVYEVTDTLAYWRFDSSDLYGQLKVGETYTCKTCGLRIPFLSWYKNIITAESVKEE